MFKRILVANRGEIAMRVIRCCREMGIETVLAVSEEDRDTLPAHYSTYSVCIGPAKAAESYLNQDAIIAAAKAHKCSAIHPGYGFLSENAAFAEECEKNGIAFIGPCADIIRRMGDKQAARSLMKKHRVPIVPGSDGCLANVGEARKCADRIGYPVLIKASSGGGGRGMRIVKHESELEKAYEEAAFNLASDQVSDIVETPEAYYLIKCDSTFNQEETDKNKSAILEERKNAAFQEEYQEYIRKVAEEVDEDKYAQIDFLEVDTTTESFFSTFDELAGKTIKTNY